MRIRVDNAMGTVEFWLSNEEKNNGALREHLAKSFVQGKAKKFMPVVYLSGENDFYESTLSLLLHNREVSEDSSSA